MKQIFLVGIIIIILMSGCSQRMPVESCQNIINQLSSTRIEEGYTYNFVWNCSGEKTWSINSKITYQELKNKGCQLEGIE